MIPASRLNDAQPVSANQNLVQLVTFRLDQHRFAVQVEQIWRVEALADFQITRVPGSATFLEGLINLRGRVIPVIDLKKRLGLSGPAPDLLDQAGPSGYPPKARLLIAEMDFAGQSEEKVAMIVDTVSDIRWFASTNLRPPPPMVAEVSSLYLRGVLEEESQLWIVLDLRQVLSNEERRTLRGEVDKNMDSTGEDPSTAPDAVLPEAGPS